MNPILLIMQVGGHFCREEKHISFLLNRCCSFSLALFLVFFSLPFRICSKQRKVHTNQGQTLLLTHLKSEERPFSKASVKLDFFFHSSIFFFAFYHLRLNIMLKKLFGNRKKVSADVATKESIQKLSDKEKELHQKQEALEKSIEHEISIAKSYATSNKRKALQALKRKKCLEGQLKHIDGVLQTIESQKTSLQNAAFHAEVLQVLSSTSKTLQIAHKGMSIDDVQDAMDDVRDHLAMGEEVSEALTNHGKNDYDENDLLAELEDLEKEESSKKERQRKAETSSVPSSLHHSTTQSSQKKAIAQMA